MPRNFNVSALTATLGLRRNDPQAVSRTIIAVLLILNCLALWFVFQPWGGSAEEMESRMVNLRRQIGERQIALQRTRGLTAKIDVGRTQGDEFLGRYFLSRPTTYSTVLAELNQMAKSAGVRVKEQAYNEEEIEGSDELRMLSIAAGYEGTYADLLHFLRELDLANRLVIIESLAASPQQGSGVLSIALRLNTFVRETPNTEMAALIPAVANMPASPSPAASASTPDTPAAAPSAGQPKATPPAEKTGGKR